MAVETKTLFLKLDKILNDPRLLVKNFGHDRAKRIQMRLDEFDAANTLQQIPSDPPPLVIDYIII